MRPGYPRSAPDRHTRGFREHEPTGETRTAGEDDMVDVRALPADLVKIEDFSLPLSFEGVTLDLLTQLLQGVAPGVVVESLAISNVTEGTCSRGRLTLDFNSA